MYIVKVIKMGNLYMNMKTMCLPSVSVIEPHRRKGISAVISVLLCALMLFYSVALPVDVNAAATNEIIGAQVAVGNNISVIFTASVSRLIQKKTFLRISFNGEVFELTPVSVGIDKCSFTFYDITPQCMNDAIDAELVVDGKVTDSIIGYSIRKYCIDVLNSTPQEQCLKPAEKSSLDTLLTDMLNYGAAAQIYCGYKTDELANRGIDKIGTPSVFVPLKKSQKRLTTRSGYNGDVYFTSCGIWFECDNALLVRVAASDVSKVSLKYKQLSEGITDETDYVVTEIDQKYFEDAGDGTWLVKVEYLNATCLGQAFEICLCVNGTTVQTLIYSIDSYIYSVQNDSTACADLARALWCYSHSATAYKSAVNN